MFPSLSFQEKSSWVMLVALVLSGAFYLTWLKATMDMGAQGLASNVAIFVVFVFILVVISIIGHIVAALSNVSEAHQALDERGKAAVTAASHYSGIVLGALVMLILGLYLVIGDGDLLFHALFLSLLVSQIIEYGLQIIFFRRVSE